MPAKKKDTYCLFATFVGQKQFRVREKLRVTFVPDHPRKVECRGLSPAGKWVTKWVAPTDLADFRIEWDGVGRKRDTVAAELTQILDVLADK